VGEDQLLGLLGVVIGGIVYVAVRVWWIESHLRGAAGKVAGAAGRLTKATQDLHVALMEIDSLVRQVTDAAESKTLEAERREKIVAKLEGREADLTARIGAMKSTPPDALREIGTILRESELRALKRDMVFLVVGALITVGIELLLRH
jgi:hypothetical protein